MNITHYLITDSGTQWFSYIVSKQDEKLIEVFEVSSLICVQSTLLSNIYGRETINGGVLDEKMKFYDPRLSCGGGYFGGWAISKLEFDRIKRMLELKPSVDEFNKIANSI